MKIPSFLTAASGPTLLTAAITALLISHSAQAANKAWSTAPSSALFSGTNWTASNVPGAAATTVATTGDALFFGTSTLTALNNDIAGFGVAGITYNTGASAFTFSGNSIALSGDITNNAANTQTITNDLVITGANRNANAAVAGSNIVLSGVVSGAFRFQATGLGTVTFNGTQASTVAGNAASSALSASGNGTLVIDLSNIAGNTNLIAPQASPPFQQLNLGNGNSAAAGTLIVRGSSGAGTSSQTLGGLVTATGTAGYITVDSNGGGGTNLSLGASVNRATGSTVLFDISSANSSLNGTTIGLAANAVSKWALVKDATGTGFATNVGGNLVRYTGGTALQPTGNTAAGNFTLAAGGATTTLTSSANIGSLNITTNGTPGILDVGAGNTLGSTGAQTPIITQGSAALTIQNGQLGSTGNELILHAIGTGGVTISSAIGGTNTAFTKSGSDTVTLSGNNVYTGSTHVLAGVLNAGSTTGFSSGSTFNIANSPGVSLNLNGFNVTVGALTGGGAAGVTPVGGGIALGANTLTTGGNNATTTFNGIISGTGGLTKIGTGNQTFTAASTYTGATLISAGTISTRNNNALGTASAVTVDSPGVIDLVNSTLQIGSLSGTGTVTNNTNAGTGTLVTGGNNTSTNFAGVITNGATGPTYIAAVTKTGTGTQTLSGNSTYTGATTVNAGVLKSGAGSTSAFGVNSATTLANVAGAILDLSSASASIGSLAGGGTTGGNVSLGANRLTVGGLNTSTAYSGVISGTGGGVDKVGSGLLTLNGANTYTGNTTIASGGGITLGTTGVLNFAIGASGVNNFITGTGAINLNGAFTFDLALAAASGTWNVVDVNNLTETYGAGFKVNGFTETTPDVWTRTIGTSTYTYNQATGILTAIPEPSALLLGGLTILGLAARRTRRAI
jgi:autotransporter-associated beta strand protein